MSGEAAALNAHPVVRTCQVCFWRRWHAEDVDSSPSPLFGWRRFDEFDLYFLTETVLGCAL